MGRTTRNRLVAGAGGRWIGPAGPVIKVNLADRFVSQRLRTFLMKHSSEDLLTLKSLLEQGKVQPVIDRTMPMSDAPEAIRYVKAGHARGKVVIAI
jgi:NADPH:quinone reductase-like Zn-dependent oxidoreductase